MHFETARSPNSNTRFNLADEFDPSLARFLHAQVSLLSRRGTKKYRKQWEKDFSFWCIFGLRSLPVVFSRCQKVHTLLRNTPKTLRRFFSGAREHGRRAKRIGTKVAKV